jgi:arylsulfatase A-like enzyme
MRIHNPKARLLVACIGILCTLSSLAEGADSAAPPRPNIIVVMADDMGFSDLGCYGGEIRTPTIDRLASEGVRFSQFYNCAVCGPSRAALMTGCYPWKVGQEPGKSIFANLKGNCATIPELMKDADYRTCAVGRLDMTVGGDWHDVADLSKGLDRFLGSPCGGAGNYYKEAKGTPWFKDGKRFDRPTGAYSTDLISDFVADFITSSGEDEKPFFIYVSHYATHWPLQADEADVAPYRKIYENTPREELMQARLDRQIETGLIPSGTRLHPEALNAKPGAKGYLETERMALHAAMVGSIDRSLAKTIAALKAADKLDNTLILVLSDNGASHQMNLDRKVPPGVRPGSMETFLNQGPAIAALNNTPFRNYKQSNYEGGIASPLIAWWPGGIKEPGRIDRSLLHIADIMATCLELSGASYPEKFRNHMIMPLAGKSFVTALNGQQAGDEEPRVLPFAKSLRVGDWKLILENRSKPELYNLAKDRNEQKDLATQYPKRVAELQKLHAQVYFP